MENVETLDDVKFKEYLLSLADEKARNRRRSVEDLEREFDEKTQLLLLNEHYELSELFLQEFIEVIFERKPVVQRFNEEVPFEDIMSYEFQVWLEQKKRFGKAGLLDKGMPPVKYDYSAYRMWKYNAIIFYKEGKKARHKLLLKDDEQTLEFLENRQFAILSPVTYVGRTNSYKNARFLYAFAIDLDGVGVREIRMLLRGMKTGVYPVANIVVNSGHGVHVYYVLERPVELYESRLKALNKLKAGLTKLIWLVSTLDTPQMQSIVQGFRVPGTLTKFGKRVVGFLNREAPLHTLEELNSFLGSYKLSDEEMKSLSAGFEYNPDRVVLNEAKERWPEWYASRVIGKKRVGKKWNVNRGLYEWWLRKLREGNEVKVHHRYWCILTLVIFGVKCNVPREEVLRDGLSLVPDFDRKSETVDNPFTADDVEDAMRAYDQEYNKWPLRVVESTTGIKIERNKRNHRGREKHIKVMNAIRDNVTHPDGEWRKGNGRKKATSETSSHARLVREWRRNNPDCENKALCARETGLTRPTVYKWWNCAENKL